jgi:two-component system, LytTR family, response regulator
MNVTALVVDDEPLARRKLAAQIAEVPWATLLGEASDGPGALDAIARLRPDVVFLDVQMPELSGVDVATHLRGAVSPPAIVFTTAYDRYAITAFELGAVDYLLKPFGTRRFLEAFERVRSTLQMRDGAAALERALAALSGGSNAATCDLIFVRAGNSVLPVSPHDVERIEGCDDYAMIHASGRRHLVSLRIGSLEARLPNPPFLRVHRSHIVNLDYVDRIAGLDDSRFEVRMKDGTRIPVSRARSQDIRRRSR